VTRVAGDTPDATIGRELDELDRHIVEVLRRDGRRSITGIAQVVGVTKQTVAKRLDRLLDSIRASFDREQAFLDDAAHEVWSIGMRVKPGARGRVAERLAAVEQVAWVAWCTGGFIS